jgi:outer membrane protein
MHKAILFLTLTGAVVLHAQAPLTLEECRRLAREQSTEVATARLEQESAAQTRKATFTKYFPQVSATAAAMAARDPLVSAKTPQTNLPVYDGNPANLANATTAAYVPSLDLEAGQTANLVQLSIQQPLFVGGRVVNGNRLAKLGEEVATSKRQLAERDAVAQAEEKYWTLLSLQEKRRTLDAYDSLLASLQREVSAAVKNGLTSRNDELKVSLERGHLRVQRLELESGLRLSVRDLRRHLGLPEDTVLALADSLPTPSDPEALSGGRSGALERRLETGLLAQGVRAEELQANLALGAMLPSVVVGAAAMRADIEGIDPVTNVIGYAMVSVPVSDIWSGTHETRAHRLKVRVASLNEAETRRKMAMGIDKDWDDLVRAWQASLVAEDALTQAEVNLNEATDLRRNGLSPLSDLLEAQALRQKSIDQRIDARRTYGLARSSYLRSIAREEPAR